MFKTTTLSLPKVCPSQVNSSSKHDESTFSSQFVVTTFYKQESATCSNTLTGFIVGINLITIAVLLRQNTSSLLPPMNTTISYSNFYGFFQFKIEKIPYTLLASNGEKRKRASQRKSEYSQQQNKRKQLDFWRAQSTLKTGQETIQT